MCSQLLGTDGKHTWCAADRYIELLKIRHNASTISLREA